MKKTHAMKWINALRSGKYRQGQPSFLKDEYGGYCCLGVLCEVFPEMNLDGGNMGNYDISQDLDNGDAVGILGKVGYLKDTKLSLADLNDVFYLNGVSTRLTFDEIADIIQIEYVEGL